MTEPTITERVQAGAAWLDENVPGWVDRIDLDVLDISSCSACLLGQVYGHFYKSPWWARWDGDSVPAASWAAAARGFADMDDANLSPLTEAWKQLIESRRAVTV